MDRQEIKKVRKRALVVAAVIAALTSTNFLPVARAIQVVSNCVAVLVCLTFMVYLLKTTCISSVREKGNYSCFFSPLMFFVVALNSSSFLPMSDDMVAILRLCAALIAIIGAMFIAVFSKLSVRK